MNRVQHPTPTRPSTLRRGRALLAAVATAALLHAQPAQARADMPAQRPDLSAEATLGWDLKPFPLDPGEEATLPNGGLVVNWSDRRAVVDDEGERGGGRSVWLLTMEAEGRQGAVCRPGTARVWWRCTVPADGVVVLFPQ